jgi:Holliday junction resolvase RusA-like endonuclease
MHTKNTIKFLIPGEPIAQIRPRFSARLVKGKIIRRVVRDQTDQEGYFKQIISKQLPKDFEIYTGPVILEMDFRLQRPKSHYGTGRNAGKIKKSAPLWPLKVPDWDNLGKFISDCFNGLVFTDDKLVVSARVDKFYAKVGCTLINVRELHS